MSKHRSERSRHHHPPGRDRQPDLLADVRRTLRRDGSFDLLAMVSTILEATDERRQDPLAQTRGEQPVGPTRRELVESFVGFDSPETTALLTVIAEMADDDLVATMARRAVAERDHSLPAWLTGLTPLTIGRTIEMSHTLGDGDNVMIEVRTAHGEDMTVMVYIDHNMGTLIKDAFVLPERIDSVLDLVASEADPDTTLSELDPAVARARIEGAAQTAAMAFPPVESETWPACRPIVSWVTGLLPSGGAGYVRPDWTRHQRAQLTKQFFASTHAASLDEEDRDLFDTVLSFGCDYGRGDPLRWSPVVVEMFLVDWLPFKVIADADYLRRAPDLLRAFVRFSHEERRIRPSLTVETLEAIDRWEPQFLGMIEGRSVWSPVGLDFDSLEDAMTVEEIMLESLAAAVGGEDALSHLDVGPLPDEAFDWSVVPPDVADVVGQVLELCDGYCDDQLDVEGRTACRRLLARVVAGDANVFRRRGRPETAAAAICWIIAKANGLFVGDLYAKDMAAWFGIKGSPSARSTTFLNAGGWDGYWFSLRSNLGTPDLLVSKRRRKIAASRDRYTS